MLRFLQVKENKPLDILTAGAAMLRGTVVSTDAENLELNALSSGYGDFFVDGPKHYESLYSIINPSDIVDDTIASGAKCTRVPTYLGEIYATSEATPGYADVGDPMNVSSGKLIKATGETAYQWVYGGTYDDPTETLYIVEKVEPNTAPATKTMTYNANTGTGTMTDPLSPYYVGKTITVAANTFVAPEYKAFENWNTLANGSGTDYDPADEITVASSNITLYAQWQNYYTGIIYNANGGTGTTEDENSPYEEDDVVTVLDNDFTAPIGQVFSEWNTAANGTGDSYDPEDEITITSGDLGSAITLYAIWVDDEDTFMMTYDANTGTGTMTDPSNPYETGDTVTVLTNSFTAPADKGFVKWNTVANGSGTDYNPDNEIEIAADMTLYAQWDNIYTVSYDANEGTGTMTDTSSPYLNGATATVLSSTFTAPSGKTFSKWNTTAAGDGTDYDPTNEITMTADITLYAQWVNIYTLTYDANGATGTMTDASSPYVSGGTATVLACTFVPIQDRAFVKWNTAANGSGTDYDAADEITMSANIVLYAQWTELFTITYDANGGTGTTIDAYSPYEDGANVVVLESTFTPPSGKVFSNWDTAAGGTGTAYNELAIFSITANTLLYAIWIDA